MANEYATRAELKDALGISDTDQDDTLDIILEGASRAVDDYCHRHFYAAGSTSTRSFTAEGRFVYVDDISTTTGLTVAADHGNDGTAEQTWTINDYTGFGFRLLPLNGLAKSEPAERLEAITNYWPASRGAVQVTANWGWPAVPPAVKQATLMQARALWGPFGSLEQTGGAPAVESIHLEGSDTVNFGPPNVEVIAAQALTGEVKAMLGRYVKRRNF